MQLDIRLAARESRVWPRTRTNLLEDGWCLRTLVISRAWKWPLVVIINYTAAAGFPR